MLFVERLEHFPRTQPDGSEREDDARGNPLALAKLQVFLERYRVLGARLIEHHLVDDAVPQNLPERTAIAEHANTTPFGTGRAFVPRQRADDLARPVLVRVEHRDELAQPVVRTDEQRLSRPTGTSSQDTIRRVENHATGEE